jgi:predicted small lipoprotein YifL
MMTMRRAALLLCVAVLAACGQKGPLFLPDKTGEAVGPTVTPVPPAPASSPAADTDAAAAERARQEAARRAAGN